MKNNLLLVAAFICATSSMMAQNIAPNAIGLRIGDSDGFGTEISYQRALGENNRLELDLGYRSARQFTAFRVAGIYQWVWNIDGGFNWYAGVGGGVGSFDFKDNFPGRDEADTFFAFVSGDIGIEYDFDFPLILSLDFRPELGINNAVDDDLDFDIALGIRYQF